MSQEQLNSTEYAAVKEVIKAPIETLTTYHDNVWKDYPVLEPVRKYKNTAVN